MKKYYCMFVLCLAVSNFVFPAPLEVDLLNERNGYVSAKISQFGSSDIDFFLSCFSDKLTSDKGSLTSLAQLVYKSTTQKLEIQSLENKLTIKKNNKGEYQILSTGAFSSSSKTLHLSLHHLIRNQKAERSQDGNITVVETVVILSTNPDERLVSYLSSKPWFYVENDFHKTIKDYRATVLTIYTHQM